MAVLRHKNIKNTLIYTQLVKFNGKDEYIVKVTRDTAAAETSDNNP